MAQELPAPMQLMQMLFGLTISRAIGVAAELCITDRLKDGPKSVQELAGQADVHAHSLYRVLRACASIGVFSQDNQKRFSLTPLAEPLLSDAPGSLRAFAVMFTTDWQFQTWAELPYSVKTGKPAFDKVFGMPMFEYFWKNQKAGKEFNEAMSSNSAFASEAVLKGYDFSTVSKVLDVGGGHGLLLASILKKYPHLEGILFEVPAIAEEAKDLIEAYGVRDRCARISGDFIESVPAGGDIYILKHIIHDWNDEQCIAILSNCRKAMARGGKVLVVEMVLPEGNEASIGKLLDLEMLLFLPGCERTESEYGALCNKAGLQLSKVIPTSSPFSIIEVIAK
jgi:hypothetical protein